MATNAPAFLILCQIFTRWVNQRLGARNHATLSSVVEDLGKGDNLCNLIHALADEMPPKRKMRGRASRIASIEGVPRWCGCR